MGRLVGALGMLFLVPFWFPVVALIYSVGLGKPLWQKLSFAGPSLVVTLASIACLAGGVSVVKRDNEHGIATAAGALHLIVGIIVFAIWWLVADKSRAMVESRLFALQLPIATFCLGTFCTLFTLLSPYSFLNRFYGEPIYDFPVERSGLAQRWPGKWEVLTEAQKSELIRYAKAFAPWSQYEDKHWADLEKHFDLAVKSKDDKHQLRLMSKVRAQLTYVAVIREENKEVGLYGPHMEQATELGEQQSNKVDAALKSHGEFWLMAPLGTAVQVLDGSEGLKSFYQKGDDRKVVLNGETALLIKKVGLSGFEDVHIVASVDLAAAKIKNAVLVPRPGRELGRVLGKEELELIDEALKEHGHLGERHDYTKGLQWLQEAMHIGLSESEEQYFFSLSKRAEFGHIISFKINKKSKKIEDVEKSSFDN